jgi:hypothetical protein
MARTGMDGSGIEPAGMSSSEALEAVIRGGKPVKRNFCRLFPPGRAVDCCFY